MTATKRIYGALAALALVFSLTATRAQALVNGLFLGSDQNGVNIMNDLLRPGEEYWFPLLVATDGTPPIPLTSVDIGRNRLQVRVAKGGNAVASVSVEEKNGLAYICVVPGRIGTLQPLEATLRLNYQTIDSNQNLTILPVLKIGYTVMEDSRIDTLAPGEFLETDNQNPLITPAQWQTLTEQNDYRNSTLYGPDWRFTVNVTGLGKRNLLVTHQADMELVREYPQHQMHFIHFAGAPDFEVSGKLELDVTSIAEAYEHDFFLYRHAFGKLYPLTYQYDRDAGTLSFRPSQLSSYLITDRPIQSANTGSSDSSSNSSNSTPEAANPDTGHDGSSVMAWLAALCSLAGLGIMGCSKRNP